MRNFNQFELWVTDQSLTELQEQFRDNGSAVLTLLKATWRFNARFADRVRAEQEKRWYFTHGYLATIEVML